MKAHFYLWDRTRKEYVLLTLPYDIQTINLNNDEAMVFMTKPVTPQQPTVEGEPHEGEVGGASNPEKQSR